MSKSEDVLSDVREDWRDTVHEAYMDARQQLQHFVGNKVVLTYARQPEDDVRTTRKVGVIDSITVGRTPDERFAVFVDFENGEEWVDPEKIIPQDEESGWVHVDDRLPERAYGSPTSEKVEVYLETGARQLCRYNFREGLWETELETLEEHDTLDEYVEYWKPLEPDPQIEGRYQTNGS